MTQSPQGPGWWQASDLNWYPPQSHPGYVVPRQAAPGQPLVPPTQPANWQAPQVGPTAGRAMTPVVLVVVLVVVVFVVAVAAAVHMNSGSGHSSRDAALSGAPAQQPSSLDDWDRAVCRPGTYINGTGLLRNAVAQANCMSPNNVPISIGKYTSSFSLENDVALFRGASYATIATEDGATVAFLAPIAGGRSEAALTPLTQFGFQIQKVSASR
jgi:hypothetical protein